MQLINMVIIVTPTVKTQLGVLQQKSMMMMISNQDKCAVFVEVGKNQRALAKHQTCHFFARMVILLYRSENVLLLQINSNFT